MQKKRGVRNLSACDNSTPQKPPLFFCRVRVHYSTDLTIIYMFTSLARNESEIIGSYLELNLQMYFQFHLVSHH